MQTYYHGTSADNLKSILKEGLLANRDGAIWNCAGDMVYLWSPDELVKSRECEEEYKNDNGFQRAFESAQCALAKAKDCRAIVIKILLDEITDEVEPDQSCDYMSGAVCVSHVPLDKIKSIQITNDLSLFRGYFIGTMANRDLCNLTFSEVEIKIGQKIVESIYLEDIYDAVTWSNVDLTRARKRAKVA